MFTYTANISKYLAPATLILSQLTSRTSWNFTYNNVSDRDINELKASQLTSCNHRLNLWNTPNRYVLNKHGLFKAKILKKFEKYH